MAGYMAPVRAQQDDEIGNQAAEQLRRRLFPAGRHCVLLDPRTAAARFAGSWRACQPLADGAVAKIAKEFLQAVGAEAGVQFALVHIDTHRGRVAASDRRRRNRGEFPRPRGSCLSRSPGRNRARPARCARPAGPAGRPALAANLRRRAIMTEGTRSMALPKSGAERTPTPMVSRGISSMGTTIMEMTVRRSRSESVSSLR